MKPVGQRPEAYRTGHPEIAGRVLTREKAVEHGIRFFGGLLAAPQRACGRDDQE